MVGEKVAQMLPRQTKRTETGLGEEESPMFEVGLVIRVVL
jgi:hypothetical protein